MYRHLIACSTAATLALSGAVIAQEESSQGQSAIPLFDVVHSARALIDADVVNPEGEALGGVHDILLTRKGAPLSAVISVGGILGVGDKLVALPLNDIEMSDEDHIVIDATPDQLQERQAFVYDGATIASLAPLGFGKIAASEAMTWRAEYLAKWSERIDSLASATKSRADEMAETAEEKLRRNWDALERAWGDVRMSTEADWDRTTNAFEDAYEAFYRSWEESGLETPDGAGERGGG
ncbi:PRC-barrel domain-containing protein [Limibaculum sp. M0105]|uniref:PRC-barrel domain-containing protein n=1 Tax=Thermohalobaculum xanthum TaxID=2753746 RepID=A0A8J7M8M9_9RHOB|nr:PRC-barrel domain-containing protein [Thermohalobaculum xanthum]MBK0400148.1 PRC-barrel domain-containing protein [Thermohalobaculum xanthum]